jgi:Outer membrane lipoprotein-sorting protein
VNPRIRDRRERMRIITALLVATLGNQSAALGDTARQILDDLRVANRAREPKDLTQTLRMTNLRNGATEFVRELETSTKFYGNGSSKTVTFFLSPFDIKGVGFLAWNDPHQNDEQWLYLPKLHRVRLISPAARRQSFQDTVFSYEDLELFEEMREWTEDDAESRLIAPAEPLDGAECAVVELAPKRTSVSYGRIVVWVHRPDQTIRKAELYDRSDGTLWKQARFADFTEVGKLPIARHVELENGRIALRTAIDVIETRLNDGLDDDSFTPWHMDQVVK